ncbi:hypothetical protein Purlil1_8089 [Purpureocillium lilacinum]|uniref:Uncharacterized protein n=1 Tax=Purpureocillium lilacinum TaxID=33203 RepID=A0ABR0BTZ5_PURLI|nr:hypothetical protein Purlil1_8089 [Purpureocillium lilacinum]
MSLCGAQPRAHLDRTTSMQAFDHEPGHHVDSECGAGMGKPAKAFVRRAGSVRAGAHLSSRPLPLRLSRVVLPWCRKIRASWTRAVRLVAAQGLEDCLLGIAQPSIRLVDALTASPRLLPEPVPCHLKHSHPCRTCQMGSMEVVGWAHICERRCDYGKATVRPACKDQNVAITAEGGCADSKSQSHAKTTTHAPLDAN